MRICIVGLLTIALFFSELVQANNINNVINTDNIDSVNTPRLSPLQESEWNNKQKELLTPFKLNGRVFNLFTTLARNPKLLESLNPLGIYLLRESSLPPRERELIILQVAWLTQSEYEFGQHTLIGLQAGLSKEEITRITADSKFSQWDNVDATILRAVHELHKDSFISESTWNFLAEHYSEKQMLDFIATVGQYKMLAMFLKSIKVPLDQGTPGFPPPYK